MKELFIHKKFAYKTLELIAQAAEIIEELSSYSLTLRQLYYQFVARGLLPNKLTEYKRLGSILNDARLAGLIDWSSIEDRTRNLKSLNSWDSPDEIISASAHQYREDVWRTQEYRPEVWIEKEALVGVIERPCNQYRVPFFACRGYTSQSEVYNAGKRMARHQRNGFTPIILHLGDHDPSGIDMTRDNNDRLDMFARQGIEVRRLALNFDQIEEHNPPPNPAKMTDSRFSGYVSLYGPDSWELDALSPTIIERLISDELDTLIDRDVWEETLQDESEQKKDLELVSEHWTEVQEFVHNL